MENSNEAQIQNWKQFRRKKCYKSERTVGGFAEMNTI